MILGADIKDLLELQEKPAPYTPGAARFWDDPYIAQQMLIAHLDPTQDAASRHPVVIARTLDWLIDVLRLQRGSAVLDLGCGPGLYAQPLASRGCQVTGIDLSPVAISYARQQAAAAAVHIDYRCGDYLALTDRGLYDAALLIYGDYCPLAPDQRRTLLGNVRRALRPHGHFVLDVTRDNPAQVNRSSTRWSAARAGFWRPGAHLVLETTFSFAEQALQLDQYIVIEESGPPCVYRIWRQDFTPDSLRAELAAAGFEIDSVWGDLTGTPLDPPTGWIGAVAHPV